MIPLNPVLATILAALIAAVAGLFGAWLNSRLTTRRERWTFKRDLYLRLLEHLHEASVALETVARTRDLEMVKRFATAVEEVRRARAIAALVLDRDTSRALDQLDASWRSLRDENVQVVKEGVELLRTTYQAVLRVARRDLGLKVGA